MTATATAAPAPTAAGADLGGTYLTFALGGEEYGIEILKVREIIGVLPITSVPGSPAAMIGVVNLRGKVIPVISMRRRFAMEDAEAHPHNVIIVVDSGAQGLIGLAVDRVSEVASFRPADTEPPPPFGLDVDASFVAALGKSQGHIRILLDIGKVLAAAG